MKPMTWMLFAQSLPRHTGRGYKKLGRQEQSGHQQQQVLHLNQFSLSWSQR